jgi:hypothetical protein
MDKLYIMNIHDTTPKTPRNKLDLYPDFSLLAYEKKMLKND